MTPKGSLLVIGGHEDKSFTGVNASTLLTEMHTAHFDILGKLIASTPRVHHVIEIIAAASSIPRDMEQLYVNAYKEAGYNHVGVLSIDAPDDAHNEAYMQRVKSAHAVFFTGGDQVRLTQRMAGTPLLETIRRKYYADPHFVVAGTSAGAMSIPQIMIARGVIQEALLKGDLTTGDGLHFIENVIVDTHFIKRGRFGRLAHAVAKFAPACTGIGLGEDGALHIRNGNEAECLGTGMVIVIDGSGIGATNINAATDFTPIHIEGLKVHILTEGCRYLIREKRFIAMPPTAL